MKRERNPRSRSEDKNRRHNLPEEEERKELGEGNRLAWLSSGAAARGHVSTRHTLRGRFADVPPVQRAPKHRPACPRAPWKLPKPLSSWQTNGPSCPGLGPACSPPPALSAGMTVKNQTANKWILVGAVIALICFALTNSWRGGFTFGLAAKAPHGRGKAGDGG